MKAKGLTAINRMILQSYSEMSMNYVQLLRNSFCCLNQML